MATVNSWLAYCPQVTFAVNKVMGGILNGGERILRVRRIGLINAQPVAAAGVMCQFDLRRMTATATWGSSPTAVTPIAHDTTNSALDTVTAGYGGSIAGGGATDVFRRTHWSSNEPATSSASANEWECLIPLGIVWECGYGDLNCQPLVVREDEAVYLYNVVGAAGNVDTWFEFMDEAA